MALLLAAAAAVVWLAGALAEHQAMQRLREGAHSAAVLRQAHLDGEMQRFRLLPVALSDDRDLAAALGGTAAARDTLNRKLEALARTTGAAQIYVLDAAGTTIASSNWATPRSFVGENYAARNYYRDAARRGEGSQFALGTVSERPGMYLSHRSRSGGYVVVKLEFDRIERDWARLPGISLVTDRDGVVLITSRPAWRFTTTRALTDATRRRFREELQSGAGSLRPLPLAVEKRDGVRIARPAGDGRQRLLWETVPTHEAGWRLNLLVPLDAVAGTVALARVAALLTLLLLGGGLWTLRERRRQRAGRAAAAAARTAGLEALVAARTRALRQEMEERGRLETRAETLRDALHQANRLASLGQITAGIAHETAQPVAAIRSYAANGRLLLERDDPRAVADNLRAIERLTDRIDKVTAQLRGFSRNSAGALEPVRLAEAIEGSLLILKARLTRVTVQLPACPAGLEVLGDTIRLEQVLVNLLQNALDALDGVTDAAITLALELEDEQVVLSICDNGPGLAPEIAARLFTPFATSRPAGLGLGLVIASDIMAALGGALRWVPGTSGARFDMVMRRP
ncbi:sensor histidine kinase [Sphingomonas sp. PL-96]|uniref:sensor histidine kinase n=1 Tax=Sphingomonas sp. PL-96 TaxID=2887201 RepID=UPI001E4D89D7|nr:ATP-binding protein [Sphingomonas sp. PL-96]MCC2976566.1 sensor histidine kinase [Sphingomonas sp. PL-96]